jgi:Fur family zinc uptake transcriptional regulator
MPPKHTQVNRNVKAALDSAGRLLSERGAQFTPLRRTVLRLLCQEQKAVGAYDLLFLYQREVGKRVAPNTIYRTLSFLEQHHLVVHLTKKRGYVASKMALEHSGSTILFTCTACGTTAEQHQLKIERAVRGAARSIGFVAAQRAIEVEGTCSECLSQQHLGIA